MRSPHIETKDVSRWNHCSVLQIRVGDGSLSGTEWSVFEIGPFHASTPDAVVQTPRIISIEPKQINSEGQESVSISGSFFDAFPDPSSTVYVQFGSSEPVVGTVVGSTEIMCTAPPTTSSDLFSEVAQGYFVLVKVTNLVNFWSNAVQLFVETRPTVVSILPGAGPSCGGTTVSVVGRNFIPSVSLVCVFGDGDSNASTPARWHSPDLLECVSPSWKIPDGENGISVPLAVGTSTGKGLQSQLSFRFMTPIVVGKILPETGSAKSSTNITVAGAHLSGYDLTCMIGGQEVLPAVAEDGYIQCAVPPRGIPLVRTFKISVTTTARSPLINSSYRYELVDADVSSVSEVFDPISQAQLGLRPGAMVLPLVRGHQYWLDQSDASNVGHPLAFSSDPSGLHPSGKAWTKGVERLFNSSKISAVNTAYGTDESGAGIVRFRVPMDAPDVLYMYSEATPGMEDGITAIITDYVEHIPVKVVATHGSACDSAAHPFRYGLSFSWESLSATRLTCYALNANECNR